MPKLTRKYYLIFYGGEPLLVFPIIKKTISLIDKKNNELKKRCNYCITTNGSLITDEIIHFFNKYKFSVELSFDGLAQDVYREKGSFWKLVSVIKELLSCPSVNLEINSVFTPKTIDYFSESINFILELGVTNINFSFTVLEPWGQASLVKLEDEMKKLRKIVITHCKRKGNIPVINFREDHKKGIFYCAAGKKRLAITPEGRIWGCFLFPDYFKGKEKSPEYQKFCFGTLDNFIKDYKNIYPSISSNYTQLSMDNFSTSNMKCLFCEELENCTICPVNAALSGIPLMNIPHYACEIQKIKIKEKEKFRKALLSI